MPLDQAILAAHDRQATALHRLHLAVAHASQIGTHYIGGGLEHPFFVRERLRIEAGAPWPPALGIDRNRRIHPADLHPQFGCRGSDQLRLAASQHEMRVPLPPHIDSGMKMKKVGVYRWGNCAGVGIDPHLAVVSGAPDRQSAPLATEAIEKGFEPGAAKLLAISL